MLKRVYLALLSLACMAFLAGSGVAHAETMALVPGSGSGVQGELLDSARLLLRDHLLATGKHQVLLVEGLATVQEPNAKTAADAGKALGATKIGVLNIIRLGMGAKVRFTVYDTNGTWLWGDGIMLKGGPEELDPGLRRIVMAFETGKRVADNAEIDTVTQAESNPYLKVQSTKIFGIRMSDLIAFNTPGETIETSGETASLPGIGMFWMYDARSWLADVTLDLQGRNGRTAFSVGIGAYYPFTRGNISPFLGGSLKWSAMTLGGRGDSGISVNPTVGLLIGRLASTQIRVDAGYFINTFSERSGRSELFTTDDKPSQRYLSHGFLLAAGIGF